MGEVFSGFGMMMGFVFWGRQKSRCYSADSRVILDIYKVSCGFFIFFLWLEILILGVACMIWHPILWKI